MSPTLEPPPPSAAPRSRRRAMPWLSSKPETRAIQIGVLGTVLIHLLLLLLAPHLLSLNPAHLPPRKHAAPRTLNIEVAPDAFAAPKPKPPPMKFVEANPNAPVNIPDKTNNFSDRNQQVAQEKPTPNGKNDMPALTGRKDISSTQIVTGSLTQPQESAPPAPPTPAPPKMATPAAPRPAQNPIAGFEKIKGDDADAFGANIAKAGKTPKLDADKVDGAKDAPLIQDTFAAAQIDPKHPQPRHTLQQHVRPAIFSDNKIGTANIGPTAVDARWSNYGVYLQRMIETVQIEWERFLAASKISPNSGSVVAVKFILNSKGQIAKILNVQPSVGTSDAGTRACVAGIETRSPYGEWSADMVAVLGEEQEMTFTFYYQ